METNYNLLKEIIPLIELYENSKNEKGDLAEFTMWLNDYISKQSVNKSINEPIKLYTEKNNYNTEQNETNVKIGRLISMMYKYSRNYSKKIFDHHIIGSLDEFGFLATLMVENRISKSDLINRHLLNITSGTEILKRLLKAGLITQIPDQSDKRSKLVAITPEGKASILSVFNSMQKIAVLVTGNLSEFEKKYLIQILDKLHQFHHKIHLNDRRSDIDALLTKYINYN